jgi:acyl-homoserine-lactone acylase
VDERTPELIMSQLHRFAWRTLGLALFVTTVAACGTGPADAPPGLPAPAADWQALTAQVEIRRTDFGVPHILAETLEAAGYAMAWVQLEDHGERIVMGLVEARGEMARHTGPEALDSDFVARRAHARAVETFPLLPPDVRQVYEGFAAGVNRYLALHPGEFPATLEPDFRGVDVLARDVMQPEWAAARRFVARTAPGARVMGVAATALAAPHAEESGLPGWEPGSNTWAFAPSRTTSGHAILMRNPHLSWAAGYYEAHVTVPGVMNFYGDFRLGGPFGMIGGWNERLGWSSTNNDTRLSDIYALRPDPDHADHYRFDGESVPLVRELVSLEFKAGDGIGTEIRERWESHLGPVIHRDGEWIYVLRTGGAEEYRNGEQFLRMMTASNLEEWTDAMRVRGRNASNFTYADADGNIFYIWNEAHPVRPHPYAADTLAIPAAGSADVWQDVVAFDDLPQLLNPPGGYLRNENDPFHHTNLGAVLDPASYPGTFPEPRVRLRSQLSLEMVHGDRRFSLEDVWSAKNTMRMLLADRVKDDLLRAVAASGAVGEVAAAARLLEAWDNTAFSDARGAVLFVEWWDRYVAGGERAPGSPASAGFGATAGSLFAEPWSADRPAATPRGLADPARAVDAFRRAVPATAERWGSWNVAWGDVHRARLGELDLPANGCDGLLGCFRVMWFSDDEDGLRRIRGGDGWVSAVEFGDTPRAFTILAYGQSARPGHPHSEDQLAMFLAGGHKTVAFTEADIRARLVRSYRPGAGPATAAGDGPFDLLLRGGTVYEGSGGGPVRGDVGIRGGRIAAVGDLRAAAAAEVVDATGLVVAPGFIDTHSHAGAGLATDALSDARKLLAQGVTTVLVNPDGGGAVDLAAQRRALLEHGLGVNVGQLVPHGSVRREVMGMADRAPTPAELDGMRSLVRRGMEAGAFGLSTGTFYAPGSYASPDEVIALAQVVAGYGGVHQSHIRDEGEFTVGLLAAVDELIEVSRRSGVTGVVSHIKALGPAVWGASEALVARIEAARAEGLRIYADQYPYEASATSLAGALVPRWALTDDEGGSLARRLADPADRARLAEGVADHLEGRGGADRIQFRHYRPDPSVEGRTLAEVAAGRGESPVETVLAMLAEGGAGVVSFNMDEGDVVRFMAQPWTMTASDGEFVALGEGVPHPRSYGTFPRRIARYTLEQGVTDLTTAIRSMTYLPAAVYGIPDRGRIQAGAVADLVLFDPERVRDLATYTDPHQYAEGMVHVLVGGRFAVRDGSFTGVRAGTVLRRAAVAP